MTRIELIRMLDAIKTLQVFMAQCTGGTAHLVTPDKESLVCDWGYFDEGLEELEKYCLRRLENEAD